MEKEDQISHHLRQEKGVSKCKIDTHSVYKCLQMHKFQEHFGQLKEEPGQKYVTNELYYIQRND
jgi:hypothetical protein